MSTNGASTVRSPDVIAELAERVLRAGRVPYIVGSPGTAKSYVARKLGDKLNLQLIDRRLSQADPTDFQGFPSLDKQEDGTKLASYVPFSDFPIESTPLPEGKDGWLIFFDELPSAPRATLAAAYKIMLDREVGAHKLNKRVVIMCAGNLSSDKAIVNNIGTAMQSRLITLQMGTDLRSWTKHATESNFDSRVIGFLNFKSDLLMNFDPDHQDVTFPCPRTWNFVSDLVKDEEVNYAKDYALLAGTVGKGAANEFITFCEIYQGLPSIQEIMNDPKGTKVPEEITTKFAMISYLGDKLNKTNAEKLIQYVSRFPADMQVVTMRIAYGRDNTLMSGCPAFEEKMTSLVNLIL